MSVSLKKGDRVIRRIELSQITASDNPRNPAPRLAEAIDGSLLAFALAMGLSPDAADRKKFVDLVEKHESQPDPQGPSLVELADSRRNCDIQPVSVRQIGGQKGKSPTFGVVFGERRLLAAVYNYAKHGDHPSIGAQVYKVNKEEAFDMAIAENLNRRDMTALEKADFFHSYTKLINPKTKKPYNLKQVAERFHVDPQEVTRRSKLVHLPKADRVRLERGEIGITAAIETATRIGQKKGATPTRPRKTTRQRVLTLKKLQEAYDSDIDPKLVKGCSDKTDYFYAGLAAAMGQTYAAACKDSEKRLKSE